MVCGITFISERSLPMLGGGWKTLYCHTFPYVVDTYVPYVHMVEWRKILQTPLKNRNGCLRKFSIDTLDFSMMKKMTADSKPYGMKPGSTHNLVGNSCQGKDAGILFGLNCAIHQYSIGCDTSY